MKRGKKFELSHIISLFKEGKKAKDIAKILKISTSNLSYYLDKLKKDGILFYKGKGVWLVQTSLPTPLPMKTNYSRGHAFIWKIKFNRKIDWKKYLKRKRISYKIQSSGKVVRIIFEGRKIWLKEKGLIIYEVRDFLGRNSFEAKGKAVFNMDRLLKRLFYKIGMELISYKFTTSREHFGLIKNELARQYNDKGDKLHIIGDDGKEWLWIDDSLSLGELENNNVNINKQLQDWWNDNKKHKFKVTPSFLMENMNNLVEDRRYWAKHQKSHIKSIQTLGDRTNANSKTIELLANVVRDLKDQVKKLNGKK